MEIVVGNRRLSTEEIVPLLVCSGTVICITLPVVQRRSNLGYRAADLVPMRKVAERCYVGDPRSVLRAPTVERSATVSQQTGVNAKNDPLRDALWIEVLRFVALFPLDVAADRWCLILAGRSARKHRVDCGS